MSDAGKYEPPQEAAGDAAHAVVRAGLSAIPVIGGSAVELLNRLITPPLERRLVRWREEVGEGLRQLEQKRGVELEVLGQDEAFVDTVMHASQAAMRNSQEEKRSALRNAVLNAALPEAPEASLREMFIGWIDDLTVWHLRILKLFENPTSWAERHGIQYPGAFSRSLAQILEAAIPEMRGRRSIYDQVWQDLNQRGLVNTSSLQGMMTADGALARRTTDLGDAFLRFIEEP